MLQICPGVILILEINSIITLAYYLFVRLQVPVSQPRSHSPSRGSPKTRTKRPRQTMRMTMLMRRSLLSPHAPRHTRRSKLIPRMPTEETFTVPGKDTHLLIDVLYTHPGFSQIPRKSVILQHFNLHVLQMHNVHYL